jgi:succinate dehydrogenase / fumarate reductase, membrane anchor subunit
VSLPVSPATGARAMPAGGSELALWWFMRVSGLVLVFLALGHLVIMHIIHNVDTIDYAFVAARWATPFWRTYDWVMLTLALLHGLNGMKVIVDDYTTGGWRVFWRSSLWIVGLVTFGLGSIVLFTFQPK